MSTILSVIDIIRALSELIEKEYPDYPINDMDIDEGFPRPSYFIEVEDVQTSWTATDYLKESSNLQIAFFAPDRYEGFLELLDMKNHLTLLFNEPLYVHNDDSEQYVTLLETTSDVFKNDKVLTFSFTADLIQKVERDEGDYYMEDLDYIREVH